MRTTWLGALGGCRAAVPVLALAATAAAQTSFDFAAPMALDIGFDAYPNSIDAGDIDEDGRIDLVLAGRNNDGLVVIFYGAAGGGFEPPVQLMTAGQTNWALIRDFNGDEHLDLALTNRGGLGRISIMLGDGTRTLGNAVDFPVGRRPGLVKAADLDGDLDLDLVVLNAASSTLSILSNDGNAVFSLLQTISVNRTASGNVSPTWAQIVDIDGDLDLDIVAVGLQAHRAVSILYNNGDGTFQMPIQQVVSGIEQDEALATVAAADFDNDGDIDLVTKAGDISFLDRLIVLTNDGTGVFETAIEIQLLAGLGGSPWDIVIGDFDNDTRPDLAWVTHAFSTTSAVFLRNLGTPVPSFDTPEQAFLLGGFPRALLPVDLDDDGDLDVVVANISSHMVSVLENQLIPAPTSGATGPRVPGRRPVGLDTPVIGMPTTLDGATHRLAQWGAPLPGAPTAASVGVCGDPDAGDCYEPHGGVGCNDEECCTVVCGELGSCCVIEWDEKCVKAAIFFCGEPPVCPAEGSCFDPHAESGCDDADCCELVCSFDGFCCDAPWDQICADEAAQVCGLPACMLPDCGPATPEPETINCNDRVNDGCNLATALFTPIECGVTVCGSTWTVGSRDTDWYEITVDEPADLSWTIRAEFPVEAHIVSGVCDDRYTVAASVFGSPCELVEARLSVDPGTFYLVVAPGTAPIAITNGIGCLFDDELLGGGAFGSRYLATVSCGSGCAQDISGDGMVGIVDLLELLAVWGTDPGGPPDFDGDGDVGITDFLILLAAWGPCA